MNTTSSTFVEREAIMDVLAAFDDAILTLNRAAFLSLWTSDGRWTIGLHNPNRSPEIVPLDARGLDALGKAFDQFASMNACFFRSTARPVIALDADSARLRVPTIELAKRHDGSAYTNVALYRDRLVKRDGVWRFVERDYAYIWVDSHGRLGGDAIPLADDAKAPL